MILVFLSSFFFFVAMVVDFIITINSKFLRIFLKSHFWFPLYTYTFSLVFVILRGFFLFKILFVCLFFLLLFSCCSYSLIYKYFYILLLNFIFFSFYSFLNLTMFVSWFCLLQFILQLALCFGLVFCFVFQLVLFLIDRYHFWFPLLTRSLSYAFFSLDCFGSLSCSLSLSVHVPLFLLLFFWFCIPFDFSSFAFFVVFVCFTPL